MTPDEIRARIQSELNQGTLVPSGKKIAFILHGELQNNEVKTSASFAVKVKEHWQVGSVIEWSPKEGVKAGVNVVYSK